MIGIQASLSAERKRGRCVAGAVFKRMETVNAGRSNSRSTKESWYIMANPKAGERIEIQSYKHNGHIHRVWEETTVLKSTSTMLIGGNDHVLVTESDGRIWYTREPAITYFSAHHWFNIICMLRNDGVHYYSNISSPYVFDEGAVKYIDYDLDIKVFPDMTYKVLDEDEFIEHKQLMNYPAVLEQILYRQLDLLEQWILQRKGPFSPDFTERWYEQYLTYSK